MMSPRDALRSYRRAWRRALPVWHDRDAETLRNPSHLITMVGLRGDRVHRVFDRVFGVEFWPSDEAAEVYTTHDLRELERMDREESEDVCVF